MKYIACFIDCIDTIKIYKHHENTFENSIIKNTSTLIVMVFVINFFLGNNFFTSTVMLIFQC